MAPRCQSNRRYFFPPISETLLIPSGPNPVALSNWMVGWNNSLPIGQMVSCHSREWLEKGLPSCSIGRGSHSSLPGVREPPAYIGELPPRDWRPPGSLQPSFFVFPPTPTTFPMGPSLSCRDISVATILNNKGSDLPPMPPPLDSGNREEKGWNCRDGPQCLDFFIF